VTPDIFAAQLNLLREAGFTTITLSDLYQYLAVGRNLPERPIILTFDDGYIDNYTNAFPLLKQYGMTGTFFVLTGRADAADSAYLSWDMIQEMSDAGMDIQLHAREHYDLRNRPYEWLVFNIIGGRQSIEGHTGRPVNFMAYTSGKYDSGLLRFLSQTNFWAAVTTQPGRQHTLKDALLWTRVRVSGQLRLSDFSRMLKIDSVKPTSPTDTQTPSPSSNRPETTSLP
jgi:peptidoglycan/xylan/chitin deacetylase (PgdA/CDA1 family)